jgi:hypothetical protein
MTPYFAEQLGVNPFLPASERETSPSQVTSPEALQDVGQTDVPESVLSDEALKAAITKAHDLVGVFMAERELHEALFDRDGCMGHKGAADRAWLNEKKANELLAALILMRDGKAALA